MKLHIKDPGSAITHFIGMIAAMFAATPLLIKAAREPDSIHLTALSIFIVSMILLYAASTIYHTLDISPEINKRLRKLDHMMIFILIAGTYTPVCMVVLGDKTGWNLLALVWGSQPPEFLLKPSGLPAPSGFLPFCTSLWAGSASWLLPELSTLSPGQVSDGFWQEGLSIRRAALFTP